MDKKVFALLVIIAVGVWANFIVDVFEPQQAMADGGYIDVNIVGLNGFTLPSVKNSLGFSKLIPVALYEPAQYEIKQPLE